MINASSLRPVRTQEEHLVLSDIYSGQTGFGGRLIGHRHERLWIQKPGNFNKRTGPQRPWGQSVDTCSPWEDRMCVIRQMLYISAATLRSSLCWRPTQTPYSSGNNDDPSSVYWYPVTFRPRPLFSVVKSPDLPPLLPQLYWTLYLVLAVVPSIFPTTPKLCRARLTTSRPQALYLPNALKGHSRSQLFGYLTSVPTTFSRQDFH